MQSHGVAHPHGQHAFPPTTEHGTPPSMRAVMSHAAGQGMQHGLFKGLTMNWYVSHGISVADRQGALFAALAVLHLATTPQD